MKILVTAKRVTDPDAKILVRSDGTGIETAGLEYKLNPFCENAIEAGAVLVEQHGGELVAVTIGTDDSLASLRIALAMGAARGIHVRVPDEQLDADRVSRILAALAGIEQPDLFLLGKQAVDGDGNQVAQMLAERLDLPQACFASKIEVQDGVARVSRECDGGLEVLDVTLPAVISADLRLNTPRLPTLPNLLKAKKKEVKVFELADLGIQEALQVETVAYETPAGRKGGVQVKTVQELVEKLHNEAKVI